MIFVFDIDGAVANNSHRLQTLQLNPNNLELYHNQMQYDKPYDTMVNWIKSIGNRGKVVFQTERPHRYRKLTVGWLRDHGLLSVYNELLMNENDSNISMSELKLGFLTHIRQTFSDDHILWVENDLEIVNLLNKHGATALCSKFIRSQIQS